MVVKVLVGNMSLWSQSQLATQVLIHMRDSINRNTASFAFCSVRIVLFILTMEPTGDIDACLKSTAKLSESILLTCQKKFAETNDLNKFFEYFKNANPHHALIPYYAHLYSIVNANGDQSYFYHRIRSADVNVDQAILARFIKSEQKWDMFVNTIDSLFADQRKRRANKLPSTLKEGMQFIDCGEKMSSVTLQKAMSTNFECKFTLLIVVRYMGCEFCCEHVMAAQKRKAEFAAKLCHVLVVCRATREGATKWRRMIGLEMNVLADEHGDLIAAIDFRMSAAMFANSAFIHQCAQQSMQLMTSRQSALRLDDIYNCIYQLGGDVLINEHRNVLFVHKSRTPNDRLSVDDLLQKVPEPKMVPADPEFSSDFAQSDAVKFHRTNEQGPSVVIKVRPAQVPITKSQQMQSQPQMFQPPLANGTSSCCSVM